MKAKTQKNITYLLLVCLFLFFEINSLSTTSQEILNENSEFAKVCTLEDGNVLALCSVVGNPQSLRINKLNKEGRVIYKNATMNKGYTADAQLVQPKKSDFYLLAHHNKQDKDGQQGKEFLLTFKDQNTIIKDLTRNNGIYQKSSVVALKNGKVLIASIRKLSGFGSETLVEVNIYDPNTLTAGTGFSFDATSNYLSCYEQKENEVYCVYVYYEDVFVSKLKIKKILVNENTLINKEDQTIKTFYTEFNFLKAIKYNDTDALILFQTGNGKPHVKYGNSGKNLYYYHIRVDADGPLFSIQRYEYLYPNCYYDKDNHDPEYYNADIAVLSDHRVYAVCETDTDRFRGFIIYPTNETEEIEEFNFNNFEADSVKNPVFTKFDKSLALFYTQITVNYNKRIAYQLLNYPDCTDLRTNPYLLPRGFVKEIEFHGRVFLINPYPASRASEQINFKFKPFGKIMITNVEDNTPIQANKSYPSETTLILRIMNKELTGNYSIEYTSLREDNYDGEIIGRTCKIPLFTPECLEQCESCTKKGTNEHHFCLGCKEGGPYYIDEDPTAVNEGYGKPHNCERCDRACSTCWGGFLEKPDRTTNCKKCDYDENYFHYEFDERTCISNNTKKEWEKYYGHAIYLDKSDDPNDKSKWRWRHCHDNCAECFEKGNDEDNKCWKCKENYYFFCNQTIGNGIPGSCHTGCVNNGFYEFIDKEEDNRKKCCECFDKCKVCKDNSTCDKCYQPFFLADNYTKCNETCGYCYAEDRNLWECVNCKTRYSTPKYTLNKTCVDEIPFIEFIKRYHHIIDDQCNLLHGCKEGCYKCDPWYSDRCKECNSDYYKEDTFGKILNPNDTFLCFNKTTCQGVTPYKHNESLRIGGVPILENSTKVCLNCKLRNNSYRLPEDKFYCSDIKINRTYIDIEPYNKLSYCYLRCKECDYWGNCYVMNCSSCRDSKHYELFKVGNYGNCYRKVHKCGVYPYYHDYDLAEVLGKDEDDCGEDCDVCMYNFTCPEYLPFFVFETHECVEYCPLTDVLGNTCSLNQRAGMLLLINPFGLKNPYDRINTTVTINEIISSKIFQYFVKSYDIDVNAYTKSINNYLGNGQIYNLPESKIIVGNNISIELTSVRLELEKIAKLLQGDKTVNTNTSIVDLSSCQSILKKKYGLSNAEDLMVIKGDILKQLSNQYIGNSVEYQLFSTSLGAFLPLNDCKEAGATVEITNPFNSSLLLGQFQFKTSAATEQGYNPFNPESSFYNDICTPFTNENGNDVLLEIRRSDYFTEDHNLCESGCDFLGYNETMKTFACKCTVKDSISGKSEYGITPMVIPDDFYKKYAGYSNIKAFKCASQVFSLSGQKKNFGSYVLLVCLVSFIAVVVLYFVKGTKKLDSIFENLYTCKKVANPPKPEKPSDSQEVDNDKEEKNQEKMKQGYEVMVPPDNIDPQNMKIDLELNEEELNSAEYSVACENDKRSFWRYYWSLLKLKQLFIFTFYTKTDHNLPIVKYALFILFLSFYFAFTALFFNDSIMRALYIYKGNTDAAVHIPNIVMSSICCLIMSFIVRFVTLSERDISKVVHERNPDQRKGLAEKTKIALKVKILILFIISGLLICLCWYYVSAFCAIFKNSQGHYFINVLVTFILCNIWPCVTSLIAPIFRIKSLKDKNSGCMYKFSQIIAYF